jgi:hypothetical protein
VVSVMVFSEEAEIWSKAIPFLLILVFRRSSSSSFGRERSERGGGASVSRRDD